MLPELSVHATYGFPTRSSARSAKIADASWPKPASYTSLSVQVAPSSSDHAIQTWPNVSSCVRLHPVGTLVATLPASQATYTRRARGPDCTTFSPPGIVLQNEFACATGSEMTLFCCEKV